jgi:beta-1,4-mannosyl-glycoprotein beta-1,4-N-acetylglucosaminyltransferase
MVLDCFLFNDELDLLELRLHTLRDAVDAFILIEAPNTHQGAEKPLHYAENRDRFEGFNIVHHVVDFMDQNCPISREFKQRNAIKGVLADIARPDDLILIGDADEIVRPEAIQRALNIEPEGVDKLGYHGRIAFFTQVYYYYLNTRIADFNDWWMPQAVRYRDLKLPQDLRWPETKYHIPNAGWHFSYLGGAEAVVRKIQSYSHSDYNRPEITDLEAMQKRIENLTDPLGREFTMERVELDETFPPYLLANQEKFRHLIL